MTLKEFNDNKGVIDERINDLERAVNYKGEHLENVLTYLRYQDKKACEKYLIKALHEFTTQRLQELKDQKDRIDRAEEAMIAAIEPI